MKNNLYLSIFLPLISLVMLFSEPLFSEEIVHGSSAAGEDGKSPYDADGSANGTVVWKGGATHIINGTYSVNNTQNPDQGMILKIEPGAIVEFSIQTGYNGISCSLNQGSQIMIEGATFSDEGYHGNISGFGASGSYIRHSKLYTTQIYYSGWMEISDCEFYDAQREATIKVFHEKYPEAVPQIFNNRFIKKEEFQTIALFGATANIYNNSFEIETPIEP